MLETQYHSLANVALNYSLQYFHPKEIVTFSNRPIIAGERLVEIEHFPTVNDYCEFMLRGMLEHIETEFILFIQWDAMISRVEEWTNDFLNYDYIGAAWPWFADNQCVGNGGFSLRSRRLLEALQDQHIQMIPGDDTAMYEDRAIGMKYRPYLESQHGIRFAPRELARQFSYELGPYRSSFGFHGVWNVLRLTNDTVSDNFIRHIDYRDWNIYKWHHVLFELGRQNNLKNFNYVMTRLQTYRPELVDQVLQSLSTADFNSDIY